MDKNGMVGKVAQFVRFGLVGLSNTLISLLIYYLLIGLQVNYLLATIAGYVISSLSGYILNKLLGIQGQKEGKNFNIQVLCRLYQFIAAEYGVDVSVGRHIWYI